MAVGDFDTYYSDNPWEVIDKNTRVWYDPELIAMFRQSSLFTPTIQFVKNLGDQRATSMVMSQLYDPHPDYTAMAMRQMWMPASHVDSRSLEIVFSRYGGKVAYNVYDDIVTYWQQNNQDGIRGIMKGALGQHMTEVMDLLARNAYIKGALDTGYAMYTGTGNTDFGDIDVSDVFELDIAMEIWLGMATRGVAAALGESGVANNIICYTSPSVIYDIQKSSKSDEWVGVNQYANPTALLRYEVGTYKNIRYVQSPKMILWNCGVVKAEGLVDAAIHAGDGAPVPGTTKVDATYDVGQSSAGVKNYVSIGSWGTGAYTDIDVNDIVTLHVTRTSSYGVSNGVNPFEGTMQNFRVTAITANKVVFDRPVMTDFVTNLGAGVYAYLTKGHNIHSSIFLGGPQAIVSGVATPPRFHTPPPIDDFEMVQRFSWDAYFGYQVYRPEVFEVVFSAGTTRTKGRAKVV